jgi:S25 ribosomal protein
MLTHPCLESWCAEVKHATHSLLPLLHLSLPHYIASPAAMAGGKGRKKKWSKNKARDKILNEVLFKEPTYERMLNEVPKVRGALSRAWTGG